MCRPPIASVAPVASFASVVLSTRIFACLTLALASSPVRAEDGAVRVVFAGDIMLDGGPGHVVTLGRDPFANVATALKDADLTVGNLECAIVKNGHAVDKPYTFRGPERALPLLKKYFSAVSLANNHSGDWGKAGFATELELLRDKQLPYFGGGANTKEAHAPLVLLANGKRVAFLGYNDFPPRSFAAGPTSPGTAWLVQEDVVRDIKLARSKADIVLIFLHWGEDLEPAIAPEQRTMAHDFIDAGADAVIGGHSHLVQDIEWYKDKPIAYGIGNFVFDYYPYDPPVWTGLIVKLTFVGAGRPKLETTTVELDPAGIPHIAPAKASGDPLTTGAKGP
jgi:poly-gamma-glutamate capsule biosynthesis protein CapA/YwtB (metallophosphatase superfamily)